MNSDADSDFETFLLSEDLVESRTPKRAETSTIDFDGLLQPPLSLHQDLRSGNGGQAWPAGMVLTKYLLRRKREELRSSSMFVVPLSLHY